MASLNACLAEDSKGSLLNDVNLSTTLQQVATAMTILGAWIGSFAAASPSSKHGARKVLLVNNIFWILGGGLCIVPTPATLFVGRFLLGLGVGVDSTIAPTLLSEISPKAKRGSVTALHQLQVTIGILASGLVCYGFVSQIEHGWQYALGVPAAISLLTLPLQLKYIPESPNWLLRNKRRDDAFNIMLKFNDATVGFNDDVVSADLAALETEIESESHISEVSWSEVWSYKRPMLIGLGLMFFQPMSGINAVIFYSTKIFGFAGVEEDILGTVAVGAINVLATIVSMYLVERAGRKILILGGTVICAVALVVLGSILLALDVNRKGVPLLAVFLVLIYIIGFAVGLGAVSWVIMSEVVPSRIRNKAMSAFLMEAWFWNLLIALFTLTTIEGLGGGSDKDEQQRGVGILLLIFAAVCVIGCVFILTNIPETKDLSLARIQELMGGPEPSVNGSSESNDPDFHKSPLLIGDNGPISV